MGRILTLDEAAGLRTMARRAGQIVVCTNGHFDLLHVGHLDYLEKARALGDLLIVGVNADVGTTWLKGTGRPIVPDHERARLLAALVPVTGVVLFSEPTAEALVQRLQPDVYVKGGDYRAKPLPEAAVVLAYGGRVELIDYLPDHSTSALIAKIQALPPLG